MDDVGNQFFYNNVGESRKQYYDLAVAYFGEGIRYFINSPGAGAHDVRFSRIAEEMAEEESEKEEEEAPVTKEMETMKTAEEMIWKEENLLTERDVQIAALDIPERIQLVKGNCAKML